MLCQECSKKSECVELCERVSKHLRRYSAYLRELPCTEFTLEYLDYRAPTDWDTLADYHTLEENEKINFPFLSDLQNKCLHLFYFKGLTYKQVAIRTNHKVRSVRHQLYKAKQLIRGHFYY